MILRRPKISIAILFITVFFAEEWAYSSTGTIKTQVLTTNTKGSIDINNLGNTPAPSRTSSTLMYTSPAIARFFTIDSAINIWKSDYSQYLIRDQDTRETPLSQKFNGSESSAQVGVDFKNSEHELYASWNQTITPSPFSSEALQVRYDLSLAEGTTILGSQYFRSRTSQPLSYYSDINFASRSWPTSVQTNRWEVHWEQIWTERYKSLVSFAATERPEDRPLNWSAEVKQAYALASRWWARLTIGGLDEDLSQQLKNNRGSFQLRWIDAQINYEPIYDLNITLGAGTVIERESIPDTQRITQVGTDTGALQVSYRNRNWTVAVGYKLEQTNTGSNSQTWLGEWSWDL